jgi:hypothetical protein
MAEDKKSETVLGYGEIDLDLAGGTVKLRPTLAAAKAINEYFNGYALAYDRLAAFDLSAYAKIVSAGSGIKFEQAEEQVFRTGLDNLVRPLTRYIQGLQTGGRSEQPKPPGAEGGGTDPGN